MTESASSVSSFDPNIFVSDPNENLEEVVSFDPPKPPPYEAPGVVDEHVNAYDFKEDDDLFVVFASDYEFVTSDLQPNRDARVIAYHAGYLLKARENGEGWIARKRE